MHITDWAERIDLEKEIQEVYLHSFLFKLGVKLVSIFLPLYILNLGYSLQTVILFFLVYYSTYIIGSLFNAEITSRIGYKHASLLSSPFILGFYLALRAVPENSFWLFPVALIGGYAFNLYWTGMNPEVAKSSNSEEREKETGFFFSMPSLASIFAPVIGGLILTVFSFPVLFFFTALIVGFSFLPFMLSDEHHEGMDYSPREFMHEMEKIDFLTFTVKGINSIGKKVLWPLYLAIIIKGSISIGGAGSFLSLGSAFTSITIGKIINEENRTKVIFTGAVIAASSYVMMSLVTNSTMAFLVSGINSLSYTAISIPIYSKAMDHSEKEDLVEYFAFREIALSLGRITMLSVLLGLFYYLPETQAFIFGFLLFSSAVMMIGALGSMMD